MKDTTRTISSLLICIVSFFMPISVVLGYEANNSTQYPLVVSTWPFLEAVRVAWAAVENGFSAVDAVVEGCSACEDLRCDGTVYVANLSEMVSSDIRAVIYSFIIVLEAFRTLSLTVRLICLYCNAAIPDKLVLSFEVLYQTWSVFRSVTFAKSDKIATIVRVGPGGSPDENGETTIDALVMNGVTMEVGAVAAMRYVKDGIRAAKLVMQYTEHTMLAGEQASAFAISMGLPGPTNLSSIESLEKWIKWKENGCQPHFRKNVVPTDACGPYHPRGKKDLNWNNCLTANSLETVTGQSSHVGLGNHDTISMAVIDKMGHIAVGTSTNGATFKIPGRVGDGPIPGSSSYADSEVGACGATGDGDIMMRFLPCYQVVESMRLGMEPRLAAKDAISRIAKKFPEFVGAVFAVDKNGVHAGACHGWTFQYSVKSPSTDDVQVFTVVP